MFGDAAHMASPRTAVGAHTATLDALALQEATTPLLQTSANEIDKVDNDQLLVDNALSRYSLNGLSHAQQLYARTRKVSQEFDREVSLEKTVSPELLYGCMAERNLAS